MGGAERLVVALSERMQARGHAVVLVALLGRQAEEWPTTVEVVRLDLRRSPAGVMLALIRGWRFLRSFRPNLIHSHVFPANMAARFLKLLLPGAVVLSTVHNVYEGGWGRMMAYRLTDWLSRRTVSVSAAGAERYVRLKAIAARKSLVVTNGIDCGEFTPKAERREEMRERMGAGEEFIWLAAGRIVPAKDYPNLLRAFMLVLREFPEARLWIAGEAAGEESVFIQAQSAELGAAVRWLGVRRDMPALLDAADGFVLASAWEGMPLVVAEAMAMEKPVVATNVGGVRELMGDAGVMAPAKDPEKLAEAMVETMRGTEAERRAAGRAERERIALTFSMEAKANEWEAVYRSILDQ